MIVLLDLEWIEAGDKHLTQLSAVRVDEAWNIVSSFDILANPGAKFYSDANHMAYGGLDIAQFKKAASATHCAAAFARWLEPGDELWVWAKSNRRFLTELMDAARISLENPVHSTAKAVRRAVLGKAPQRLTPYELLAMRGVSAPRPEHRSCNDVEAMRLLFRHIDLPHNSFTSHRHKPAPDRRAENAQMIARSQYNFLFLKGSEVFHNRDCKLCLNAKSKAQISGSAHYETAAKNRRPCKVCKPQPDLLPAAEPASSPPDSLDSSPTADSDTPPWVPETVKTRLVNGVVTTINRSNVVGWCKYDLHPGTLTKALLEQHECLQKQCFYLVRNEEHSLWAALVQKELDREKRKAAKRARKETQARRATAQQEQITKLQSYLDKTASDMYIVRIEAEKPWIFKIYYVSDNALADGRCYPDFYEYLSRTYPNQKFLLRHIRAADGHFVTRDEYFSRRK